ncbi:MAG: sulfatase-like hydrolase/transferase [Verrucomicrobiales bacterium]
MKFLSVLFLSVSLFVPAAAAEGAPNIVLILTDDHGWTQLSELMDPDFPKSKSEYLESPNINQLIAGGMRFTSGYSPAPLCTPTRRSILCGTSAARSGTEFKSPWVPADHLTIPKALKRANPDYRCAHFGKWGEQMISTPEQCGYDASHGETGNNTGGMPNSLGVKGGHGDGPPHFINNEDPKLSRKISDSTIDFMKKQVNAGNPFYVQASYYAQHLSVVCSDKALKKYESKGTPDRGYTQAWAGMLDELDQQIGRILDSIEDLDIEKDTYVFFTADNGGRGTVPGGDSQSKAPNYPLTGAKHTLFEGGVRVPFLAMGPGVSAGSVSRVPVVGYDFLPTFYSLAGGTDELEAEVDGVSFVAAMKNPKLEKIKRPQRGLIFHRPGRFESAIRYGDFKLRLDWNNKTEVIDRQLYLVGQNPIEEGNDELANHPEKAAALEKRLLAYLKSVDAEKAVPRKPKKRKK